MASPPVAMLGSNKIKQAQEDINALTQEFSKLKESSVDMKKMLDAQNRLLLKQQAIIEDLTTSQSRATASLNAEVKQLAANNDAVRKEIHNLKSARTELDHRLVDTFRQQTTKSLHAIEQGLTLDTKKIDSLLDEFASLQRHLNNAKTEVARLTEASKSVKAADDSLKKHAELLKSGDAEKIKLLKRIDELESLLAKMKRGRTPRPSHRRQ